MTTHAAGPRAGSTFPPLMMNVYVFSIGLCFCRHGVLFVLFFFGGFFSLFIFQGFDHFVRNKFRCENWPCNTNHFNDLEAAKSIRWRLYNEK